MLISSPANERLKHARRVRDGLEREEIFVEGERLVGECIASEIELIAGFHIPTPRNLTRSLIAQLRRRNCPLFETTPEALATVGDTVTPSGIIILARRPQHTLGDDATLLAGLEEVQDPGNLGTIVRTAEASGVSAMITTRGTVDTYSPKALRSAMGSAFRLPVIGGLRIDQVVDICHSRGLKILATTSQGGIEYTDYDWCTPSVVFFGNEARGISDELTAASDHKIQISVASTVESLNVGAAAAVVLFEAKRQRDQQSRKRSKPKHN